MQNLLFKEETIALSENKSIYCVEPFKAVNASFAFRSICYIRFIYVCTIQQY